MGDFVASSSTLALADGWRPMGMAPPTRGLESGAREGRMTMDSHSHSFDLLATGEQGLSMSDHFLEEVSFEKIRFDFRRALVNIQRQENENGVSLDGLLD